MNTLIFVEGFFLFFLIKLQFKVIKSSVIEFEFSFLDQNIVNTYIHTYIGI